jgi:hypothetical protein
MASTASLAFGVAEPVAGHGFHSACAALTLVHLTCGPITLALPHETSP